MPVASFDRPFRDEGAAALEQAARLREENEALRGEIARLRQPARFVHRRRSKRPIWLYTTLGLSLALVCGAVMVLSSRSPRTADISPSSGAMASANRAQHAPGAIASADILQFDQAAANRALGEVDVQTCKDSRIHYVDGLNDGEVDVAFSPGGQATGVTLKSRAFDGSAVGGCIERKFRELNVPRSTMGGTASRRFRVY